MVTDEDGAIVVTRYHDVKFTPKNKKKKKKKNYPRGGGGEKKTLLPTKVYNYHACNITEIRSSTGLECRSDGVLAYQSLSPYF